MNPQQQELLAKIKAANNILVTVSANPSVDQLAACLGMTLMLNKLKKHATAVFSGEVPSTIEFLKPEDTLEKNTDSLRDFIISLDKSKADKLRYKVEDQVVRIFITPYRTSISDKDLDFSQGDFNVDVVLCLGVNQQQDLDQAITVHGRILHDATVLSINTVAGGELGTVNWTEPAASSLSELVAELVDVLGKELLDGQIATSLLTGIVAETDRFSNEKTSPETMRLSAELMSAGANQQLVASELETKPEMSAPVEPAASAPPKEEKPADDAVSPDGTLEITHPSVPLEDLEMPEPLPEPEAATTEDNKDEVDIDLPEPPVPDVPAPSADVPLPEPVDPDAQPEPPAAPAEPSTPPTEGPADTPTPADSNPGSDAPPFSPPPPSSRIMLQPPSLGGTLTANSIPQDVALQDPLTAKPSEDNQPILDRQPTDTPLSPMTDQSPPAPAPPPLQPQLQADAPVAEPPTDPDPVSQSDPVIQMPPSQPPVSPAPSAAVDETQTLSDLEKATHSPHAGATTAPAADSAPPQTPEELEAARDAVINAINSNPPSGPLPPVAAAGATGYLNVQDLPGVTDDTNTAVPDLTEAAAQPPTSSADQALPPPPAAPAADTSSPAQGSNDATPAPPVPPPLPLSELSKFSTPNP